ncbi:PREDICTED: BAG family molecular chaperone regulator 3 [Theobroma cacao]|uniref:BAG family molecular chaperone regulator 3 n=1 Tax=Theobroma cacao TaxID=3641 RepID=A0AB32VGD5_THECC|nr:PREDICTED: BAG family molecular chaperone regulator 3 [Theobroma cacao]
MMKRKSNVYGRMSSESANNTTSSASSYSTSLEEAIEWEMRPGGMLVQKRTQNADVSAPDIRLRVAYGAVRYEISVNSQATFGEVKKLLRAETGLQAGEQRVIFKGKERENGEYLDICGVKDRSKVILMEDPASIERRFIEMRRNAKIQSAHRAINDVSMEVDQLADQVSAIEKSISGGVKVPEVQVTTLIEMLMRQAIKLENIAAEGDAFAQKILQGKRVQKCVETLDTLKISNAKVKPVIVTTKWETFEPSPAMAQWEIFD